MASKAIIGAFGVVAALGIGGTAWATTGGASSGSTDPSSMPSVSTSLAQSGPAAQPGSVAAGAGHRIRSLLERADHASVELKVKGQWVTYDVDRGQVKAVSPTSITLARPDGQTVTATIDATTKFQGVTGEGAIQTGQEALVLSDNGMALRIRQRAGAQPGQTGSAGQSSTGAPSAA
jgi:hypothetical protein